MSEPQKPFACSVPECGMTFTNEDHLHVHTKKHDMNLTLGMEQKAGFVDQTPTPTRFIRNCEEVGLFQDLQNVNPFDEGFRRAMETKAGIISLDGSLLPNSCDDSLHTPQMYFGDTEQTMYRNITVSRSSSDESTSVRELETTTISKLTNEVKHITVIDKSELYQNQEVNVVKIQQNLTKQDLIVNVNKDDIKSTDKSNMYSEKLVNKNSITCKDVLLTNRTDIPPIISQKSLDLVVDSLTCDAYHSPSLSEGDKDKSALNTDLMKIAPKMNEAKKVINKSLRKKENLTKFKRPKIESDALNVEEFEVTITLPNKRTIKMKAVEDIKREEFGITASKDTLRDKLDMKLGRVFAKKTSELTDVSQELTQEVLSQNMTQEVLSQNMTHPGQSFEKTPIIINVQSLAKQNNLSLQNLNKIPIASVSPQNLGSYCQSQNLTQNLNVTLGHQSNLLSQNNEQINILLNNGDNSVLPNNAVLSNNGVLLNNRVLSNNAVLPNNGVLLNNRVLSNNAVLPNNEVLPNNRILSNNGVLSNSEVLWNNEVQSNNEVLPNKVVLPIAGGTLIPISLLNIKEINNITPNNTRSTSDMKRKRRVDSDMDKEKLESLERRSAASKRYRDRFKTKIESTQSENVKLKILNKQLHQENAALKYVIIQHIKKCADSEDLFSVGNLTRGNE